MTVKLFQDAGGTIPAVLAGQPVGFIKRTKGSDDAKQATALSKPTYARHPRTGVRNVAMGSEDYGANAFWRASGNTIGLTFERVGVFEDPLVGRYIRYRMYGAGTGGGIAAITNRDRTRVPVQIGSNVSISGYARIVSNTFPLGSNVSFGRVLLGETLAPLIYLSGTIVSSPEWTLAKSNSVVTTEGAVFAEINLGFSVGTGNTGINGEVVFDIAMVQMELNSDRTAYQFNYGPNDIVEAGVPDLWHLYNDGGDSLNVTLPAGTYGLASIGIDRQIVIGTFVSDGTTPVNILRHERQLDVSYRLGAYSAAEELAIRDAWGRKYA